MFFVRKSCNGAPDSRIVGFGAATGEYESGGAAVEQADDLGSGMLDGLLGILPEPMAA